MKWWKKVFYKLFGIAIMNVWIIYKSLFRHNSNVPLFDFIVPLAEQLVQKGRVITPIKRKAISKAGRNMKKQKLNKSEVSDHLPLMVNTRRHCIRCSQKKNRKQEQKQSVYHAMFHFVNTVLYHFINKIKFVIFLNKI